MKFIPGQVVRIVNLQKASYYLYKAYLKNSPLLICPCIVKRDVPLVVLDEFDHSVVLLQVKGRNALTMTYGKDLELIYEPKANDMGESSRSEEQNESGETINNEKSCE